MIIAIDGPSGAGKSTLGKMLAKKLGLLYIDTGAMYRAAALAVIDGQIGMTDTARATEIIKNAKIELVGDPDSLRVFLNGHDVSEDIRTQKVANAASIVSTISQVRSLMVEHQRSIGSNSPKGAVLEGRDIGSVVFPKADFKFFLTAQPEARARRRFAEDNAKGRKTNFEDTLREINERDERDVSREDSPLTISEDASVIDTSELDLTEVLELMLSVVESQSGKG